MSENVGGCRGAPRAGLALQESAQGNSGVCCCQQTPKLPYPAPPYVPSASRRPCWRPRARSRAQGPARGHATQGRTRPAAGCRARTGLRVRGLALEGCAARIGRHVRARGTPPLPEVRGSSVGAPTPSPRHFPSHSAHPPRADPAPTLVLGSVSVFLQLPSEMCCATARRQSDMLQENRALSGRKQTTFVVVVLVHWKTDALRHRAARCAAVLCGAAGRGGLCVKMWGVAAGRVGRASRCRNLPRLCHARSRAADRILLEN